MVNERGPTDNRAGGCGQYEAEEWENISCSSSLPLLARDVVPADHRNLRRPFPIRFLLLLLFLRSPVVPAPPPPPAAVSQTYGGPLPVRSALVSSAASPPSSPFLMYCGYGYSATTLALRANASLCRSRRLALLDDPGDDEYPLRGFSVNPRFLLYGYYFRHSRLIYWSPLRSFLAGHDGHSYSRISFRDYEPCSPRVSARREGCMDCCCCRSSRQSYRMIGECCRGKYGDRIWEDETDYDELDNSRRFAKGRTETRSKDREKVRSLRARKDGSCSVCPSCGSASKKSVARNIDGESGRKVNATARKARQVQKMEDAVSYDSSEESDESDKYCNVRVSNRKATGRDTDFVGLSHQEKEDRQSTEEDKIKIRDSRRKSGNRARISLEDEDFNVASKSNNVVDSRKVDKGKYFTPSKQHSVVDKRLVEKTSQEFDNRVQKGASWCASAHRIDEDYYEKQHIGRRESREGSQNLVTESDVHEDGTMMASRCKKIVDGRKVDMAEFSKSTVKQHHQVDKRVVEQTEMRTDVSSEYVHHKDQVTDQSRSREGSERFMRISEAHKDCAEKISRRENVLNARKENKEQSSVSTLKQHTAIGHQLIGSYETREHLQNRRLIEEVHSSNTQRALNEERRHEEMIVKNRDDKSISVHIARDNRGQVNQQVIDEKEVDELHENRVSGLHLRGNSSQSLLQSRIDDQADYSTSTVNLVHQAGNLQNQSERQRQFSKQSSLQRESGRNSSISEHLRKDTGRLSSAHIIYSSDIKDELDDRQRESVKDSRISKYSSTDIQRNSNLQELSNVRVGNLIENTSLLMVQDEKEKHGILIGETSQPKNQETAFTGMLDDDFSSLGAHMQQLDDHTQRGEMDMVKGGALDSASRLESSSAIYLGEFVDKLRQETSSFKISSGTRTEETQNKSHQDIPMKSGSLGAMTKDKQDKLQEGSRRSLSGSGTRGPSDEIWDVRSPISQEDSRKEEMGEDGLTARIVNSTIATPTAENTIVRRNPKSLWAHVADILRMGWAHRAESHTSTQKSGKRSSSEGSEAWFSGQDASDNENDMNGRSSDLKVLLPVGGPIGQGHETNSSTTQGSLLEAPGIAIMESGSGASTSVEILGGNVYKGASFDTRLEKIELAKNEKESENITSGTISFDQPQQPLTSTTSSVTIDENTVNLAGTVSLYTEDLKIEEPSEVDKTEGKDGEIKRRKLQRNKQVLKETFEDWEEAYRLESEQRKIDEFFMREALMEAQKAADIWEVPVGAVLVHNGKIIARGSNLVEEKRDSTAHAEMICIREASNLLRTWRLAETTLYVTLEPCAMCAGAILQARIDTVVWGAPNKLLGADGSWVRLFPGDGDGGSYSLDASSQIAGPVHPFHPKIQIRRGVLATECSDVMQQFFQLRRKKKKKKQESPPPACLPVPNHPIKLFTKMHHIFSMFC